MGSMLMRLIIASIFVAVHVASHASDLLSVQTTGGRVLGLINDTTPNVRQFLSVPYAQPPLGDLRFAPPAPLNDSDRTVDTTQYGPACPQAPSTGRSIQSIVTQLAFNGSTAEDCLTLAIWAPVNSNGQKLPVFIWLFGGGFNTGGIYTLYQIPAHWVERTQSHVVISVNTRVNVFGYPGASGLRFQNPGLLDQRFAIEWAVKNIAAFGGDPDRITVWGQSSGAGSVDYLNFAYPEDPIVTGFISDSGSVFLNNQKDDPTFSNFSYVAAHFNCSSSSTPAEELDCMRNPNISSNDIISFMQENAANSSAPFLKFVPFVDNISIFPNYTDRYLQGAVSSRPAIFGANAREGYQVAPFPADPYDTSANSTLADAFTLQAFSCPASYSTQLRDRLGLTTFRYQHRGNFTNISPIWWFGAYHATELPLLFGTYGLYRGPPSAFETATSREMQDLWLAFARNPTLGVTQVGNWTATTEGYVEVFGQGNDTAGLVKRQTLASHLDESCTTDVMADIIDGVNPFAQLT